MWAQASAAFTHSEMRRFFALMLVAAKVKSAESAAAQSASRSGCYRADRSLGTSASTDGVRGSIRARLGEADPALRTLATFRLLEEGRVDRPGAVMREWWARGSRWSVTGDTLNVRLSTGTSGWNLRLVPTPGAGDSVYVGNAGYLTDVIVKDWRPPEVSVRVTRELCAPPT